MLRLLLPPMMLLSSSTVFSVFCNFSSKTAIFSAMLVSFSPTVCAFWSELREQQQLSSPEHELTFPSFCASQRHQQNPSKTTIFFIALSKYRRLYEEKGRAFSFYILFMQGCATQEKTGHTSLCIPFPLESPYWQVKPKDTGWPMLSGDQVVIFFIFI